MHATWIRNDDPAIFPHHAAVVLGHERIAGQQATPDGAIQYLFQSVPAPHRVSNPTEGEELAIPEEGVERTIQVGENFYRGAVKDYYDWQEKWWREAIQNAVDAGATEIHLSAEELPDGSWKVACEDNGKGMTREVLYDKFLVMGATSKENAAPGVTGGFGKAKELLLLPWMQWSVSIDGYEARGRGFPHKLYRGPARQGVRLEVVMPRDQRTTLVWARTFLGKCDLSGRKVTVGGEAYTTWMKVSPEERLRQMEGLADVYVKETKGETQSYLLVRINGLYMFAMYMAGGQEVIPILELTAPSTTVLTANRDGFVNYSLRTEVEKFVQEIAVDRTSALRAKRGLVRKVYRGGGQFEAAREKAEAEVLVDLGPLLEKWHAPKQELRAGTLEVVIDDLREKMEREVQAEREAQQGPPVLLMPSGSTAVEMLNVSFDGPEHQRAALQQLVWKPDFFLINERDGFRVPKAFLPNSMSPSVVRLLRAWTELCRFVLIQLGSERRFGVGFYFSNEVMAACATEDGQQWLVLNPYKTRSPDRIYFPGKEEDLSLLYALAIHECTHLHNGRSYHDEDFATAMTMNMAKCAPGWRHIRKIIRSLGQDERQGLAKEDAEG